MRIIRASLVAALLMVIAAQPAFALRQYQDNQGLFRKGCYIEDSRLSAEDTTQVCGYCRNTGYRICCNAFSETNTYSCGVAEVMEGSGTGRTISEAAAKACGCF
ncbi:hypothetical protein DPQ33_01220 [Oceanidesulfovibrio indonesiensis]|uniref:Uncharacterized protein n=1 Tax=Oceanidesulfovibrio indonesiensis TaxID=54767 RepID=A0A7M3MJ92_9BACT|nr:hypothetical protein [Oceanidesulfovibrio indonesiensis]TVM19879.1 hypothetical protein DPQ33_01220 [Oceanidesulfovibrio indonesiensis]